MAQSCCTMTRRDAKFIAVLVIMATCLIFVVTYTILVDPKAFEHRLCPAGTKHTDKTCPCVSETGECQQQVIVYEHHPALLLHYCFIFMGVATAMACAVALKELDKRNE